MGWLPYLALLAVLDPEVSQPSEEQVATPPGPTVSAGMDVTLASTYVFRGVPQYGPATMPSLQPSAWLALEELGPGALQFDVWTAFAVSDWDRVADDGAASEVDLGVAYRASLLSDWLLLGAGFMYYMYPDTEEVDGEKEFLVEVGLGNMPIVPSVELWTEVHPGLGVYIEPGVTWEQGIGDVTVGADLCLGASIYRGEEARLDHTTLAILIGHSVGDLTFGVRLSYAIRLARGQGSFVERSLLFGALSLSYEP
jgi:hypothetical protein